MVATQRKKSRKKPLWIPYPNKYYLYSAHFLIIAASLPLFASMRDCSRAPAAHISANALRNLPSILDKNEPSDGDFSAIIAEVYHVTSRYVFLTLLANLEQHKLGKFDNPNINHYPKYNNPDILVRHRY